MENTTGKVVGAKATEPKIKAISEHCTIQDAINSLPPCGGMVEIPPGYYETQPLVYSRRITLVGE